MVSSILFLCSVERRMTGAMGTAGALMVFLACAAGAQSLIATVPMVNQPEGVAVNSNTNRIYALNYESPYTLRVFNGSTNAIIADVSVGFKPQYVAVNPITNRIYTTHYFLKSVTVVDGNTNAVIATVPLTGNPTGLDVNTSTNRIYVASFADASQGGAFAGVWTIDGNTNAVVTSLALVGGNPSGVAVDPGTKRVYVGKTSSPNGVYVIDTATNSVMATISMGSVGGLGVNPITQRLYAANPSGNTVSVVDETPGSPTGHQVIATVGVGSDPSSLDVDATANRIYVANSSARTLSVINGASNQVIATMALAATAGIVGTSDGVAVNPTTHRIYVNHEQGNILSIVEDALPDLQIAGKIAFFSNRDGNYEIYTMNADGSGQTRLTNNSVSDANPGLSPDGTKIVFPSNRDGNWEIYVMNVDGSGQTRLTNNSASEVVAGWSPDGTKIVFPSDRDGNWEVYTMDADGSDQTRLTINPAYDVGYSWSPDGTKIAFRSDRDGAGEIYVMNADGSGQTRLTSNSSLEGNPIWSPDGSKIAFQSNRDGNDEVYVMNADGSGQTRLTYSNGGDAVASWSPDGTKIAFHSERDGNSEIYVMNADGGQQTRRTSNAAVDESASWAPFRRIAAAPVGGSASRTMAVENKGGATLVVSNITSSDEQFTVGPTSFSVAAGDSQFVTVSFNPTSAGVKYSTLTIISNDPDTTRLIVNGSGEVAASSPGALQWRYQTGGGIRSTPAIGADGTIYLSSTDGSYYAVRVDGTLKWRYQTGAGIHSSPTMGLDGTMYAGSGDAYVYAINSSDGTLKWRYRAGALLSSTPAVGWDGTIYIASDDSYVYALNSTGTLKWRYQTGAGIHSSPAIGTDGTIYVGSMDGALYALNSTGTLKWKYQTSGGVYGSPAIGADGAIYFGSDDFNLYALNSTGTLKWRYRIGNNVSSSPAIGADGSVYVGAQDHYLHAVNSAGILKWKYLTGEDINSDPAIGADGTVYVGSHDSYFYAINSIDGTLKWRYQTGAGIEGAPTLAPDGTVYVGSWDRNLYAIDTGTGSGVAASPWPVFGHTIDNRRNIGMTNDAPVVSDIPDLQIAGKIAFMTRRDGAYEIYAMNADGSGQTRLTNNGANDQSPSWSPDGTKIAFQSDRDGGQPWKIITMDADGSNPVRLTYNATVDYTPVWLPDGNRIVFNSSRDGNGELYAMEPDGSNQVNLTHNAAFDANPSWSPDGARIAFYSNRDGNEEIYVMNADGSGQSRLTSNSASDSYPSWSPDGSRIAFVSTRDGNNEVYVMNADGSGVTRLTNNPAYDAQPCWSPDGTKISFDSDRTGNYEIYVMNADGSGVTLVGSNPATDAAPTWAEAFRRVGSTIVATPVSRTITIKNVGSAPLTVSNITSSDGQFTISPTGLSVNAGSSQNVAVTFTPTSVGTKYATLTINSNDPQDPTVRLIVNGTGVGLPPKIFIDDVSVTEGNSGTTNAVFTVSLSSASGQSVKVAYNTTDGTAVAGSDYVAQSNSLIFAPGETSKTVSIQVNGDVLNEPDETFSVNLNTPTNATIADGQGVGTILNDDAQPSISINDVTVTEGDAGTTDAVFTVTLTNPSSQTVTVDFSTADGTALAGGDYVADSGTLTFGSGETAKTITVKVNGDLLNEVNETFLVNMANPSASTALADGRGVGTIVNDDLLPALRINDVTMTEGNTGTVSAVFSVDMSASGQTVTVNYATANGTAVAGSDYVANSGMLTLDPGETSKTITIQVNGDNVFEPNETFLVNLSSPVNATIADVQGGGTILNDDAQPSISINDMTVTEGDAGTTDAIFIVTLSNPSSQPVTAEFATASGTAMSGSDYEGDSGSLTFNPLEITKSITVKVNCDLTFEANEAFLVNLSGPVNATLADAQGVGTILNDDPQPSTSIGDVTVIEGEAGTIDAIFTVTLSNPSNQEVMFSFATANGTATAGSDYHNTIGTLTFPPETTSQTITVKVNGDLLNEADENFYVNMSNQVNATIVDGQGVGTIRNDDPQPTLSINDVTVTEGNVGTTNANFTVSLSAPSGQEVTVNFATANDTALAGSDYEANSSILKFALGETSRTVTVLVNGDNAFEPNETFLVNLSSPVNATIADAQGVGTVLNDDPLPALSIDDVIVTEGDAGTTGAIFTVTLSNTSGQEVTVNFATANGTALAGSDYQGASGILTFNPLETSKPLTVKVNGDLLNEIDETFSVNLGSAVNATLADGQGVGTILNDDPRPTLSINDVTMTEGDAGTIDAIFTVTLSNPSGQEVTVNFATANGTALAPGDYQASAGPLKFVLGETTKTIMVKVNGDLLNEADETFLVNLTGQVNAVPGDMQGTGTIRNDDPLPRVSINDVAVTETDAGIVNVLFTVSLSAPSGQEVKVNFATANGTAEAPGDFAAASGNLVFVLGQTTRTITVAVNGDMVNELDEQFFVNLSSPVNVQIADGQGVGTIRSDDHPPDCANAVPSVAELWPPNHQMVGISVLGARDPDGDPLAITVTRITQDEPVNAYGDGNTSPDGGGIGTSVAQVRAERSGTQKVPGNGRVYVIWFSVSDGHVEGTCTASMKVCVPYDQGKGKFSIDDGQKYDSVTGKLVGPAAKLAAALEEGGVGRGNYPNPFNPATTIVYSLSEASLVRLVIYNVLGQQVKVLVDEVQGTGGYAVEWAGTDMAGRQVESGVYFYRLEAGPKITVGKMLLLR